MLKTKAFVSLACRHINTGYVAMKTNDCRGVFFECILAINPFSNQNVLAVKVKL